MQKSLESSQEFQRDLKGKKGKKNKKDSDMKTH